MTFPLTDYLIEITRTDDRAAIADAGKVALEAGCRRDHLVGYLMLQRGR